MRFYDMKHQHCRIPSHRASQRLSIGYFGRKLHGFLYEGIGMRFYEIFDTKFDFSASELSPEASELSSEASELSSEASELSSWRHIQYIV